LQRSRWRKPKPWAPSTTIKRKHPKSNVRHGEAKWYLETMSTIGTTSDVNNNDDDNNNNNNEEILTSPTINQPTQKTGK
jgi:hypothetical protein